MYWVFELQITCIIYKLKLLISLIQLVETESVRILSSFVFSRWGICHQGSHLPWPYITVLPVLKLNYMYGWLKMLLFFLLFVSVSCKSLRNSIMLNLSPFLIGINFPGEFISLRKQPTFCITTSGFPPKMMSLEQVRNYILMNWIFLIWWWWWWTLFMCRCI